MHAACVTEQKLMCDLQLINQTEYCLQTEKTESVFKMHPTTTICYSISHTQGTTRFTVCIKP